MGISEADSALSARPKANAPHMAGALFEFGDPGRNRLEPKAVNP